MSKTKINGITTIDFPSTLDGSFITTTDVSKYINSFFSKIFADYKGCIVNIDQTSNPNDPQTSLSAAHPITCDLYFAIGSAKEGDSRIRAFDPITDKVKEEKATKTSMNYISRVCAYNTAMTDNKLSIVTQDAVDILHELLWGELINVLPQNPTPKVFNERGIALETSVARTTQDSLFSTSTSKVVYGVIRFIDINAVFHMIFGDKDENNKCYYMATPVKPVVPYIQGMQPTDTKWLICLNRLNEKGVRDIMTELGASMPSVGPNISTSQF